MSSRQPTQLIQITQSPQIIAHGIAQVNAAAVDACLLGASEELAQVRLQFSDLWLVCAGDVLIFRRVMLQVE